MSGSTNAELPGGCRLLLGPADRQWGVPESELEINSGARFRATVVAAPGETEAVVCAAASIDPMAGRQLGTRVARIYIASKTKHGARWKALRDIGRWPIISTWIDEYEDGATSDWADLWDRCIAEVSSATALIMYVETEESHKGSLLEIGVALRSGVPIYWVGPTIGSVAKSGRVTLCGSVGEALALATKDSGARVPPELQEGRPEQVDPQERDDLRTSAQGFMRERDEARASLREARGVLEMLDGRLVERQRERDEARATADAAGREARAERATREATDAQFCRTLDALDARSGDDETLPSSARRIIAEVARLRARVRVEAEDVERAGVTSAHADGWLAASPEWTRIDDGTHAPGPIWHRTDFPVVCPGLDLARAIGLIAGRENGRAWDILDEMAAMEVGS